GVDGRAAPVARRRARGAVPRRHAAAALGRGRAARVGPRRQGHRDLRERPPRRPRRAGPAGEPDEGPHRTEDVGGHAPGRRLIAALHAHAAKNPEDPCVFFPDRLGDWRWKPWRRLESEASRWAAALREIEPGAGVGYRWRPTPEAVAADLGIQLAGAVAVPAVEGDEAALPELVAWLPVGDEPAPEEVRAP